MLVRKLLSYGVNMLTLLLASTQTECVIAASFNAYGPVL